MPSTTINPINFVRVAEIISDSQIVLNIGTNSGVAIGDEYIVYGISDNDIIDPNTGKSLGRLEIYKGTGQVVYLQNTMCILQAINTSPFARLSSTLASTPINSFFSSPAIGDYAKLNASKVE